MTKKYKKILLSSVSIVGLATIVPIVVTSCGVNSTLNSNSSTEKPGQTNQKHDLVGDETNQNSFEPKKINNGLYNSIIDSLLTVGPVETNSNVDKTIQNFSNPSSNDVKDFINMWSFNKWFDSKNNSGSLVSMVSRLSSVDVLHNSSNPSWYISFNYAIELITNENLKIFAEKKFYLNSRTLGDVYFSTSNISFKINNSDQLNDLNKNFDNVKNSSILEIVKNYMRQSSFNFNAKSIAKDFLKNKGIKGSLGTWKKEGLPNGVTISNDNILNIDLNELTTEWHGLKKGMKENEIEQALVESTINSNGNIGKLKKEFQDLINNQKDIIRNFQLTSKSSTDNVLKYNLSLIKSDFLSTTSHIHIKNFVK